MTARYMVEEGSQSGHCCFEYTVVDTSRPGIGHQYDSVCECWESAEAEMIATALNSREVENPPRS